MKSLLLHVHGKDTQHVAEYIGTQLKTKESYIVIYVGLYIFGPPGCFPALWNVLAYVRNFKGPAGETLRYSVTVDPTYIVAAIEEETKMELRLFLKRHNAIMEIWEIDQPQPPSSN